MVGRCHNLGFVLTLVSYSGGVMEQGTSKLITIGNLSMTRITTRCANLWSSVSLRDGWRLQKHEYSENFQKGRGVFINPIIPIADFGPLDRAF